MTQIRCDYDGDIPDDVYWRLRMLFRLLRVRIEYVRFDRTRNGYHMIVQTRTRITPLETVLMQSLLGSDWKREMFNTRRARNIMRYPAMWRRAPRWNVLYMRHWRGVDLYDESKRD